MRKITHLGLFEGIGGFMLAAKEVGWDSLAWVEKDSFCQKVLRKNFKNSIGHEDIKEFNGKEWEGKIDVITGGFPCQPFSVAGRRGGKNDDRFLWGEMFRVIREVKPTFVVGENVAGLVSMENGQTLSSILSDLESEGYKVQSFIIPACAVQAPHRRDRIWIVAYASSKRLQRGKLNGTFNKERNGEKSFRPTSELYKTSWEEGWYEVASKFCRVDDGIPSELDKNKSNRLKALGNSIVPDVAFEVFKCIEIILI